jgi:hypothetical protein
MADGERRISRGGRAVCDHLECRAQLAGALIAVPWLLFQTALNHRLQRRRHPGRQRGRRIPEDRRAQLEAGSTGERADARAHLVEHHTESPHVAARVGRLAAQLFRRHVRHRAEQRSRLGDPCRRTSRDVDLRVNANSFRQTKIQHLDAALRSEPHVRALQIAVDDAAVVGVGQRVGELDAIPDNVLRRQWAIGQHATQGATLDDLHRDVGAAARLADLVDRADVGMTEGRGRTRFGEQPRAPFRIVGQPLGRSFRATSRSSVVSRAR